MPACLPACLLALLLFSFFCTPGGRCKFCKLASLLPKRKSGCAESSVGLCRLVIWFVFADIRSACVFVLYPVVEVYVRNSSLTKVGHKKQTAPPPLIIAHSALGRAPFLRKKSLIPMWHVGQQPPGDGTRRILRNIIPQEPATARPAAAVVTKYSPQELPRAYARVSPPALLPPALPTVLQMAKTATRLLCGAASSL